MSESDGWAPGGLALLPYQEQAVRQARQWRDTLIADPPGTGKTITTAGILNSTRWDRGLIACPASLRINWSRELAKWLCRGAGSGTWSVPEIVIAGPNFPEIATARTPPARIVIASYDFLARHLDEPRAVAWDWLICDEAHLLAGGSRTQRGVGILGRKRYRKIKPVAPIRAARKLFLTGTPIVNRPIEMQPVLAAIDRAAWGDRMRFAKRFCDARHNGFGWDFSGASNLDELERRLRASCMIRRSKADVLAELPPKRWQVLELPADGDAAAATALERELLGPVASGLASQAGDRAARDRAIAELQRASKARFAEIAALRRRIGIAKLPRVIEIARMGESSDANEKAVIFAQHHAVIDALVAEFGSAAVKLDGRDSPEERDRAVRRFQDDPGCRWFVGSIRAAGVGLTLTAAARVILAELDWTPGAIEQAEDRCHRLGQTRPVLVQYLVTAGSIEALAAELIVAKSRVIEAALDGGESGRSPEPAAADRRIRKSRPRPPEPAGPTGGEQLALPL